MTDKTSLFDNIKKGAPQGATLLENVNTEGLSKQQKKKLKARIRKQKQDEEDSQEEDEQTGSNTVL
jgi:hypothetical protein